jgi:hypothetical protein
MSNRTLFISKLLGLYCLIASLVMFTHKQDFVEIENSIVHNPPMLFIAGIMTLFGGLAIVLTHNVWSGGALPFVVTLLGWLTLIKGAFLIMPESTAFWGYVRYGQLFYLYTSISFVLGVYLTYGGFKSHGVKQSFTGRRLAA